MNNEIWKDIKGYEGLYQVSNTGKIKSTERIFTGKDGVTKPVHERILVLSPTKVTERHPSAHYSSELWKDNKRKRVAIHRVVADAFIDNPEGKPQVNHIDGNPSNNNIDNLEWNTNSENVKHAYKLGLRAKKNCKPIVMTNNITGKQILFKSVAEAARHFDVTEGAVKAPLKGYGRSKYCCGYTVKYQ
jgi:hypothetical protein